MVQVVWNHFILQQMITCLHLEMRTCFKIQAVRAFLVADLKIILVCHYHFEIKNILESAFSKCYWSHVKECILIFAVGKCKAAVSRNFATFFWRIEKKLVSLFLRPHPEAWIYNYFRVHSAFCLSLLYISL